MYQIEDGPHRIKLTSILPQQTNPDAILSILEQTRTREAQAMLDPIIIINVASIMT